LPQRQAAKAASKGDSVASSTKGSRTGSKASTPLTSSANGSVEDLSSMAKLRIATDRSGSGVLTSDPQSRDIHIESYSLSFHGRLLIENADFSLNYGQRCVCGWCRRFCGPSVADLPYLCVSRYGLLGENGSGKVRIFSPVTRVMLLMIHLVQTTFLESMANRDVEIPEHIDVSDHSPRLFSRFTD
jgi:ATP-binding cassette subfamily F protein 2